MRSRRRRRRRARSIHSANRLGNRYNGSAADIDGAAPDAPGSAVHGDGLEVGNWPGCDDLPLPPQRTAVLSHLGITIPPLLAAPRDAELARGFEKTQWSDRPRLQTVAPRQARGDTSRRRSEAIARLARAVQDFAPAPVVVASRLGASREVRRGGHHLVVGAIADRRVGFAPVHVENLPAGVGIGLTTGTVSAGDTGGVGKVIRHRLMARISIAMSFPY